MPKIVPLLPLRSVLVLLLGISAVLLRGVFPGLFWATILLLPAIVLVSEELTFLKSKQGKLILLMCFGLLILHVTWAYLRAGNYSAAAQDTYWRDDFNYFREASAIAASWENGVYPEIWKKGASPYLGTLHVGYHRPLASMFYVFGSSTIAGLLLNALCASLLPLFVALSSRYLWVVDINVGPNTASSLRNDPSFMAAALAAAHPHQFYWASYVLKDVYVAFTFLLSMTLVLGALRRRNASYGLSGVLVLSHLFTVRIYAAVSLLLGIALYPALRLKKLLTFQAATIFILMTVLMFEYTNSGNHLFQQMTASMVSLAPGGQVSSWTLLKQIAIGIPPLFLAPYAWLKFSTPSPMYGMFPGMWFMYLVAYPLGFAGLYAAIRKNLRPAVLPIAAFGLGALVFLVSSFGGNASRQRFYLEYVVLIFAGYGFVHPSRWWIGSILGLELAFAVGQVMSLR